MTYYYKNTTLFINAVKTVKSNPGMKIDLGFSYGIKTSKEYLQWFRNCLNAKINRNESKAGRKFSAEYQQNLKKDAVKIAQYAQRMRNTGCRNLLNTPELKKRFPHIDNQIEN